MTALRWLAIALSIALACSGCSFRNASREKNAREPIFGQRVGRTEAEILREFGEPNSIYLFRANQMRDELRRPLDTKVAHPEDEVKELVYMIGASERFFWLAKAPNGDWVVVDDVAIPPGWMF